MSIVVTALALWLSAAPDRVKQARQARAEEIREMFAKAGVRQPPQEIYLRIFKEEGELELWAGDPGRPLALLRTYRICARSGQLGPKRAQGDGQVPEGFYRIARFNPTSAFHLSLGLDYPNASDRARGRGGNLGGDIFIHGGCATIGCIPIQDAQIEEVYLVALEARAAGQAEIPVHVFPRRLGQGALEALGKESGDPALLAFWKELEPAYQTFEESRRPPRISVAKGGAYLVTPSRAARAPSAPRRTRP